MAIIGLDSVQNPSGINSCTDRNCDTGTLAMVAFPGYHNYGLLIWSRDGDLALVNFL